MNMAKKAHPLPAIACRHCGKAFAPRSTGQVFCSDACYKEALAQRKKQARERNQARLDSRAELVEQVRARLIAEGVKEPIYVCPVCLRQFTPKTPTQRYCGIECSSEMKRTREAYARAAASHEQRACEHCGKPLPRGCMRFCSRDCANAHRGKEMKSDPLCRFCGKVRTWNYRCPACRRAWQIRNGVTIEEYSPED